MRMQFLLKKPFKLSLFIAILLLFSSMGYGQRVIKGTVRTSDTGESLPGVNIIVKGTNRGVITDIDGNYKIEVKADDKILLFSFIGYEEKEVEIGPKDIIDVVLQLKSTTLDEIVVVGYGTMKKSDLTGSVASVKSEDLTRIPASSPMQALQGKVAGLQVVTNSGVPGSGVVVRVRGVGTFNNSNPIYVVDGVILDNIDFLNSSDIESMEVLKDASATTIYGARGANGVIMVSTKRAKMGQTKVDFNISYESSIQKLQRRIDLLSGRDFAIVVNEFNPGTYNNVDAVPNTNWQSVIFHDGLDAQIHNLQISASGASEKGQYYVGVSYFNQDGIIDKSNYERFSIKSNNTYNLTKKLTVGNNFTITPYQQQNTNGNVVFVSYRAWPTLEPYQADGSYTPLPGTGNPLADIEYTNSFNKGLRGVGNFFADAKLFNDFVFKSSFGVDVSFNKSKSFTPVYLVSPQQQNSISRLYKGESDQNAWVWENTINFNKEINSHRIDALIGYTMQSVNSEYISMSGQNLTRDSEDFWYINPNNINPNTIGNGINGDLYYSMISYLFRINYSYNSRFLFTTTYRIDGSSKFTEKNRYAGFPAFAVGWNIHNESFMKQFKAISNFKLKFSWGGVGNEKITYSRQYSLVGTGINSVFGVGDIIVPGQTYSSVGNPDLRWETTYQTNTGFELGFWGNKMTFEFDYFNKITKDILIDLQLPGFVGNGSGAAITKNAAKVLNRGVEFNLRWNDNLGKVKYSVGLLGNTLYNEVLKVRGTGTTDDYLVGNNTRSEVGIPIGSFYGYKVIGIFQNQNDLNSYPHRSDAGIGDLRYMDVNNDNKITDADRTNLGSPIPKFTLGLNLSATYQNLDLNLDFQGQYGNKIFNAKETIRPDLYNFESHVLDRWHGEGTSNSEPRASAGGYNFLPSSRFIQDASFFKLRSITLGYTLPTKIVNMVNAGSIKVYLSGTNVFTLTKVTGYSPEILGGPIDSGLDYGSYPVPSVYSFGVRLTF